MWFKFSYGLLDRAPCRSGKLPTELLLSTVTPCSRSTFFPAVLTAAFWTPCGVRPPDPVSNGCGVSPAKCCWIGDHTALIRFLSAYGHLLQGRVTGRAWTHMCSCTEYSREAGRQRESLIGLVAVRKKTLKVNIFLSLSLSMASFVKTAWKYLFRGWTLPSKFNFEACQALLKPYHQWFPSLLDQEDCICYGIRIVAQNSSQQGRGGVS